MMSDVSPAVAETPDAEVTCEALRRVIRPGSRGIEIGPWCNPVAPKRAGCDTLVVDIVDADALRAKARERGCDEASVARIETVDLVGDASRLLHLVRGAGIDGRFDWIVSSHNFEHLPDPIRFLRDCEALLAPDGALAMIIPDKRFCFDRFHPSATCAGMVEAHERVATCPVEDAWTAFRHRMLIARHVRDDGTEALAWPKAIDDPARLRLRDPRDVRNELHRSLGRATAAAFVGHRWRFTPATFEAILFDLRAMGLISLHLAEVMRGNHFGVVLRPAGPLELDAQELIELRTAFHRVAEDEAAVVSGAYRRLAAELAAARAEIARLRGRGAATPPHPVSSGASPATASGGTNDPVPPPE
jgi:SAM-dependent methyltransferase